MSSLLPINSTPLERALEFVYDELTENPLRTLYDADTCPTHLLPWLAWAWSVDRWDHRWSETIKRAALRSAFSVHSRKGTIAALKEVLAPLVSFFACREWWQEEPPGVPGTFNLELKVLDSGLPADVFYEIERLIDDTKPVSRHLLGLLFRIISVGNLYIGAASYDGDEMFVLPPDPEPVEVGGVMNVDGREHTIDSMDIYP